MSENQPFFSIITPMYNRAHTVARTIHSCLNQDFSDFEMLIVDDASQDDSIAVVQGFRDPRIQLICQGENRGHGPTRNTAMAVARGQWFLLLDSDDELVPGALTNIYNHIQKLEFDVGMLRFNCRRDDDLISPFPPLQEEIWDYEKYIRYEDSVIRQDTAQLVHRKTFAKARYPDYRISPYPYQFDLASQFLTKTFPDIIMLVHQDAGNQMTKPIFDSSAATMRDFHPHKLIDPLSSIRGHELFIQKHGQAIRTIAPRLYARILGGAMKAEFLAQRRRQGLRYAQQCLTLQPLSLKIWAMLFFGMLGPRCFRWINAKTHKYRFN